MSYFIVDGTDDIFKYIFSNENFCLLIQMSLGFAHEGPINT